MALPNKSEKQPSSGHATGPQARRLKKGELLFAEGENSRAMYFIKTGMIRLFKKKGDAHIELDTVHSGQVLGELAFLDGNPRSASGEALTDCELAEISGPTFQDVLNRMPDWLKILLKTVVGRLRTASTRIRQLETASVAFDYSDKEGKRSSHYVYLSPVDVLKIMSSILLVASHYGNRTGQDVELRVGLIQRYANQIMGVPIAKITSLMDVIEQAGIIVMNDDPDNPKTILRDIEFLERLIDYLNEENLLEPSKRHDLSIRGFLIMSLIARNLPRYPRNPTTGFTDVNVAEIRNKTAQETGKDPFRIEETAELVKLGYATNVNIKSLEEAYTIIKGDTFMDAYRLQRIVISIQALNEQKKKAGLTSRAA